MQDIRVELRDEAAQRERLGGEEGQHLEPTQRPGPEVLEDGAVGQVLPAPGEVPEAADLQRPGALPPGGVTDPGHQHDGLEAAGLLLGQVPDESRCPFAAPARKRRGDDDEARGAAVDSQGEPPETGDPGSWNGRGILTASGRSRRHWTGGR
jgi:hypothetical protein